jgi:hypothetical protein
VARDGALAFEFGRDDGGKPVAAVALDFEVFAGQAGGDELLSWSAVMVFGGMTK